MSTACPAEAATHNAEESAVDATTVGSARMSAPPAATTATTANHSSISITQPTTPASVITTTLSGRSSSTSPDAIADKHSMPLTSSTSSSSTSSAPSSALSSPSSASLSPTDDGVVFVSMVSCIDSVRMPLNKSPDAQRRSYATTPSSSSTTTPLPAGLVGKNDEFGNSSSSSATTTTTTVEKVVEILMETPVADDSVACAAHSNGSAAASAADAALDSAAPAAAAAMKSSVKPKRLSDEFFSADDGSDGSDGNDNDADDFDDDDDDNINVIIESQPARSASVVVVAPSPPKRFASYFAGRPAGAAVQRMAAVAEQVGIVQPIDLVGLLDADGAAEAVGAPQSPPTFDDASPKSATLESHDDADDNELAHADDVYASMLVAGDVVGRVVDAAEDSNDTNGAQSTLATVHDDDVSRMDALERHDVEEEHRLTGSGGLIRCGRSDGERRLKVHCRKIGVGTAPNNEETAIDSAHVQSPRTATASNAQPAKSPATAPNTKRMKTARHAHANSSGSSSSRGALQQPIPDRYPTIVPQSTSANTRLVTTPTSSRSKRVVRFRLPNSAIDVPAIRPFFGLPEDASNGGELQVVNAAPDGGDDDVGRDAAVDADGNIDNDNDDDDSDDSDSAEVEALTADMEVGQKNEYVYEDDEDENDGDDDDDDDRDDEDEEDEEEPDDEEQEDEEEEDDDDEDDDDDDEDDLDTSNAVAEPNKSAAMLAAVAVASGSAASGNVANVAPLDGVAASAAANDANEVDPRLSPIIARMMRIGRSRSVASGSRVAAADVAGAAAGNPNNGAAAVDGPAPRYMFMDMGADNDDYEEEAWADCVEVPDNDEVCTCRNYSDEEDALSDDDNDDDEFIAPSGDEYMDDDMSITAPVHISQMPTTTTTTTPRTAASIGSCHSGHSNCQRKRRLTDCSASTAGDSPAAGDDSAANSTDTETATTPSKRKRTHIDAPPSSSLHIAGTPTTSSSSSFQTPGSGGGGHRTPRSLIIPTRDNPPPELSQWLLQFQRWTNAERLLATDRLIDVCEPTQVRHMMKVIEPQFQRDFISLLPKELALDVLSFLEPEDLLRAAQTCRSWRFLCDDNLLWKDKCRRANILCDATREDRPRRGRAGNMPPIASVWKAAYMRQTIIEMNWRSRPIRAAKTLKGHDDHVITCLQFCGNRIVSGSDDNTLKVWSAITGKCLRTLVGHTGGVWSSQMAGNIIISGSTDRTLKVWNGETGQCTHTLYGHTSTVRCMHLHGNKVVSGSRDATLRVWDILLGKCLHILVGHLAAVRCVQYDGKLVVSGAYDYMVKVWNPERQECLHTLQGHTNRVYSLQFDGVHVVSGSLDTSIRVWDAETGNCKHTLMGHQSLTSGMELRQNILVSGNADSTVKVWDITNGQCLQTLSGAFKHQSAVTCLQFNSRFVVTSSDDGTVKLWDVRTGQFIRNLVALESGGSGGVVWRIRANDTKLICAVGSRNGTEETKLMVLDFDVEGACLKCS